MSVFRVPSPTDSAHSRTSISLDYHSVKSFDLIQTPYITHKDAMSHPPPPFLPGHPVPANQGTDNTATIVTLSLTDDQLSRLLSIINVNEAPVQKCRSDSSSKKIKPSSWPEWDGSKELYPTFIVQLAAKVDTDWDL